MEGDKRGFRIAVCADALVNPEPGGLDALAVCERADFGVMQLPATWYPADVAASLDASLQRLLLRGGR